jgi:hypothetical protein
MSIVARVLRIALVGLLGSAGVQVAAQGPPPSPGVTAGETMTSLSGCAGSGSLELNIRDDTAMLDDTDRAALGTAMLQRYPMLGRDGFAPAAILLWRKRGGPWLYVTLAKASAPGAGWCFSATFTANVFDATPVLVRKYFFAGADRT